MEADIASGEIQKQWNNGRSVVQGNGKAVLMGILFHIGDAELLGSSRTPHKNMVSL